MQELTVQDIQKQIINLPNRPPAMLARDVAMIYGVDTKRVNEAVQRNPERFPEDFCFRLNQGELENLRSQNATSSLAHGGTRHLPWMFTRFGANQLSTVLKSPVAAQRSVQIIRAFSALEEMVAPVAPPPPVPGPEITWEEYTGLLKDRITLMEYERPLKKRPHRPFTDDDRSEVMRLHAQGLSQKAISVKLDRSSALVNMTLRRCKEVDA